MTILERLPVVSLKVFACVVSSKKCLIETSGLLRTYTSVYVSVPTHPPVHHHLKKHTHTQKENSNSCSPHIDAGFARKYLKFPTVQILINATYTVFWRVLRLLSHSHSQSRSGIAFIRKFLHHIIPLSAFLIIFLLLSLFTPLYTIICQQKRRANVLREG